MDTYKLEGRTFGNIKFTSIFETDDLVTYGIQHKILNNAFELEIWKLIKTPVESSELMLQLENGILRHGLELYEKIYNEKAEPVTRKEAVLALPMLTNNKDNVVTRKHKLVRKAA